MKLLITGGLGFIGSCFIRQHWYQHKMICVDKCGYAADRTAIPAEALVIYRDIAQDSITDIIAEHMPFDWIVHFAADSHVDNSIDSPVKLAENNILSTLTVLEASRYFKIPLVYVSTDEVFGEGEFTEESAYRPHNPYSASKAAGDMLCYAYQHTYGTEILVTHSCNNYGPYQYREKFVPTILHSIKANQPVPVYGDGLNVRDWIYVEDNCSAINFLLEKGVIMAA